MPQDKIPLPVFLKTPLTDSCGWFPHPIPFLSFVNAFETFSGYNIFIVRVLGYLTLQHVLFYIYLHGNAILEKIVLSMVGQWSERSHSGLLKWSCNPFCSSMLLIYVTLPRFVVVHFIKSKDLNHEKSLFS